MHANNRAKAANTNDTKRPDLLRNYRKLAIPAVIAAMVPDNEAARQSKAERREKRGREDRRDRP